ncbi:hypothetical protein Kirov_66 [Bacillus phage Kirov]|uniref:Uncharacterized protein n=1 Tax=Bacillus phage Kirov TaxID=2783539 RepID=A0A7U3NKG6_9CAUD|nr:hypothetical protein PQE67_gp238 [Bacillus phage Kirov]QOV08265.1 hypothetical protein Kirov_66 [Bacillus phage Kirov]
MNIWDKMKDLFLEKEDEPELDPEESKEDEPIVYTQWVDGETFKARMEEDKKKREKPFENTNFVNLEKEEPEPEEEVAVQINGAYEFVLEKNKHAERLNINYHGIEYDLFDIFIVFHASINCTVDGYALTIPAHYKIHMAGGMSEEKAYINLAERTEEEEREFIMDELEPRVIHDIREKISEERYKQIKKQVEEKGKIRFDVVMNIDKDKLTK